MTLKDRSRIAPTPVLIAVVLFASWLGGMSEAGYFVKDWAPAAFVLALLFIVASVVGWLRGGRTWWTTGAISLFVGYAVWTFLSMIWSPNQGDAWLGAGQTLLYLLAFWVAVGLIVSGASRRWVLLASTVGPSTVALFTLLNLASNTGYFFENNRLFGTVQYYNGEAAFLLVPFWAAVYLAGSRRINPILRGVVLAGAVLCVAVAVLTQSRGAMVSMALSIPVYFLFSGQRLRGFLSLVPIVAALILAFPGLNDIYLAFLNQKDPAAAVDQVLPTVWLAAAGSGLYGLLWGLIDRRWRPPIGAVRLVGSVVLACTIVVLVFGMLTLQDRVGNPVAWGEQKWEAFKSNDASGEEQSRYLSASGSGRYTLWQVAWTDFTSHPVLGVGTHNYEATYYQKREEPFAYVRQPHMLPLEVLGERGAVGGVLFFGFVAACTVAALSQRFQHLNAEGKAQVGAMTAATAYWFVHSSAEWFWQMPAITLPAVIYLAMLVAPWDRAAVDPPRWPLRAAGAAVAVVAIVAIAPLYLSDFYLRQSQLTDNPWVALQAVERAQEINPMNPYLPQREAELALQIGDWPRAEDSYREAIRLNPEHYGAYYLLALFQEKRGEREQALRLYREASSLNPLDEEIKERLARLETETASGADGRDVIGRTPGTRVRATPNGY